MRNLEQGEEAAAGPVSRSITYVRTTAPWLVWLSLGATWAFMAFNTLASRAQFVPDSRYYVAMTYRMLGASPEVARGHIVKLDDAQGWATPPVDQLFGWGLVQPRVLYPALSAPFVAIFGTPGMVVVPVISMAVVTFAGFAFLARRYGVAAALVPVGLLTMSTYMMFFGTAMVTEGLAMALGLGILATLPLRSERSRSALVLSGALVLALAFTRQAWMLPVAGIIVAWLGASIAGRTLRNRWLPFVVVTTGVGLIAQIVQSIAWPSYSIINVFKATAGADTLIGAIANTPAIASRIVRSDLNNYLAHDRALLVLLAGAFVVSLVLWRRVESHLYLGMIAAGAALNILNGTPTAFRYQMPGLAFVLLVTAVGVSALAQHTRQWRADLKSPAELNP